MTLKSDCTEMLSRPAVFIALMAGSLNIYILIYEQRHANMCLRNLCGQRRRRSDCANAQSDLGLHCPLIEALDTVEHIVV